MTNKAIAKESSLRACIDFTVSAFLGGEIPRETPFTFCVITYFAVVLSWNPHCSYGILCALGNVKQTREVVYYGLNYPLHLRYSPIVLIQKNCVYVYIYIFVNFNLLTPDGSSTVHIYTQTIHRTTKLTTLVERLSGIPTHSGQSNWEECGPCSCLRVIPWHLPYN